MEEIKYHLSDFDGPLDLLLQLIEQNKMDIHDIRIVEICEQYMAYIEEAKRLDLEIASEFIVMASELLLIKSKMLLPGARDREDPRKELVNQLELYIATKTAAEQLKPLFAQYSGRFSKETDEIPPEKGAPLGLDPSLLSAALTAMLARVSTYQPEPELMISPLIRTPIVSVEKKIGEIVTHLENHKAATLWSLLLPSTEKADLLARFMGILELIKIGRILICESIDDLTPAVMPEENEKPDMGDNDYNATAGLSITFILNPDYNPDEDEFRSEFETDAPETDDGAEDQVTGDIDHAE